MVESWGEDPDVFFPPFLHSYSHSCVLNSPIESACVKILSIPPSLCLPRLSSVVALTVATSPSVRYVSLKASYPWKWIASRFYFLQKDLSLLNRDPSELCPQGEELGEEMTSFRSISHQVLGYSCWCCFVTLLIVPILAVFPLSKSVSFSISRDVYRQQERHWSSLVNKINTLILNAMCWIHENCELDLTGDLCFSP